MITIVSPSKTLDYSSYPIEALDTPQFRKDTLVLAKALKSKSAQDLKKLMSISDNLAELNYQRYQQFSSRYTDKNSKAALFAFKGDVYLGLEATSMSLEDVEFAQNHLRILSGFYGLLKPLDKMQAYRLEMGTNISGPTFKDLYDFWKDKITKQLNKELASQTEKTLVNLASIEYFKAIDKKKLKGNILDIQFKEFRNGKLSFVSFNAKKARGLMSRFIIQNKLDSSHELKAFNLENYSFDAENSRDNFYQFVR